MNGEVCDHHDKLVKALEAIAGSQQQAAMDIAVIKSTLSDMKDTKALNCEARIGGLETDSSVVRKLRVGPRLDALEDNSNNCQELRVGPRLDKVETRQEKILLSGVLLTMGAVITGVIKWAWK